MVAWIEPKLGYNKRAWKTELLYCYMETENNFYNSLCTNIKLLSSLKITRMEALCTDVMEYEKLLYGIEFIFYFSIALIVLHQCVQIWVHKCSALSTKILECSSDIIFEFSLHLQFTELVLCMELISFFHFSGFFDLIHKHSEK